MELKNGLCVKDEAITLAIDLERRGHVMTVTGGNLVVSNGSALTPADIDGINAMRFHLMAIATYGQEEANELVSMGADSSDDSRGSAERAGDRKATRADKRANSRSASHRNGPADSRDLPLLELK